MHYLQLPSWNLTSHLQNAISTHEHTGFCTLQEKYGVHSWQAGTGYLVPVQIGRGCYTSFRAYFSYYFFCVSCLFFFFFYRKNWKLNLRATKVILEMLPLLSICFSEPLMKTYSFNEFVLLQGKCS